MKQNLKSFFLVVLIIKTINLNLNGPYVRDDGLISGTETFVEWGTVERSQI